MALQRMCVTLRGRVQGVGFRYFAREIAEELGLAGWVRNLHDDEVQVVAEGEEGLLARFLGFLRQGPRRAEVTDVDVSRTEPTGEFDRFYIRM